MFALSSTDIIISKLHIVSDIPWHYFTIMTTTMMLVTYISTVVESTDKSRRVATTVLWRELNHVVILEQYASNPFGKKIFFAETLFVTTYMVAGEG